MYNVRFTHANMCKHVSCVSMSRLALRDNVASTSTIEAIL